MALHKKDQTNWFYEKKHVKKAEADVFERAEKKARKAVELEMELKDLIADNVRPHIYMRNFANY